MNRLRTKFAMLAATLVLGAACSTGTSTPSGSPLGSAPANGTPTAGASEPTAPIGLGAIVFNSFGALSTIDVDGTNERPIHEGWDGIGLSADGETFFSPLPAPDGRLAPLILPTDGSGEVWLPVTDPTLNFGIGDWSPDGTRLVLDAWDDTDATRKGLYTVALDGSDLVRLTEAGAGYDWPAYTGTYSPTGDRILFFRTADETDSDGVAMNLFVVSTDGTGLLQLNTPETTTALRGPGGVSSWSPDGTQVVFVATEGDWATEPRAVFIAGTDGEPAQRITDWGDILTAQWSPDGERIAMTVLDGGKHQIFTVRPDGSDVTPITSTDDGTFCFGAMWSPDSSQLLYLRGRDLRSDMDLWVSDADGTNPMQVTHASSEIGGYDWVP